MLRQAEPARTNWDLFVMLLAIYNSFSIPIFMAFQPASESNPGMIAIDFIIDMLFMFDIVLNLRTTFIHPKTGIEISDPKEIAKRYMAGGRFWLDLISSFPFDFITALAGTDEAALSVFGLLKLLRIFRLSKIIMYMRQREEIKGTMKLLQLLLFLYIYVHLGGWIFFMIVSSDEEWIPPTDSILGGTELYDAGF